MRRIQIGVSDGRPVYHILYDVGDRVKIGIDGKLVCATIKRPAAEKSLDGWAAITTYHVRLDTGEYRDVPERGIVKQADTGGLGKVKHLEEF